MNDRSKFLAAVFLLLTSAVAVAGTEAVPTENDVWYFAVSGDSRNCGDVVMPAIARKVRQDNASFYWHLGDFRAIYDFDQDFKQLNPDASIESYESSSWQDFIDHQLAPFGDLPVYLSLGNHETINPKTRILALQQFADWLDTPELKRQRLADDPHDHMLKTYYHWIERGIDFITLDNASEEQFDDQQLVWFRSEIKRDAENPSIRTVVVGMHEALPDSFSTGHSMNESAQAAESGRAVYQRLVDFRQQTHKHVYVVASHSHFYLENAYNTRCRQKHPESVLPGWIVGTAGAVRYRLPVNLEGAGEAKTDVYGYLLGMVDADGSIRFQFKQLQESDLSTTGSYSEQFVHSCFVGNSSKYVPQGPPQLTNCP